jgi:hypothetical protein
LAESAKDLHCPFGFENGINASRSLFVSTDEQAWLSDVVAAARHRNCSLTVIGAEEEADVLTAEDALTPSAEGYRAFADENLRLSEANLDAAFEVLPPE